VAPPVIGRKLREILKTNRGLKHGKVCELRSGARSPSNPDVGFPGRFVRDSLNLNREEKKKKHGGGESLEVARKRDAPRFTRAEGWWGCVCPSQQRFEAERIKESKMKVKKRTAIKKGEKEAKDW